MSGPKPTRHQGDLAEMLETLLEKGVVINADVAVTVGDTELLGVEVRAAIASFETAAEYGLEFPGGTDMRRVRSAAEVDARGPTRSAALPAVSTVDRASRDGGSRDDEHAEGADGRVPGDDGGTGGEDGGPSEADDRAVTEHALDADEAIPLDADRASGGDES